MKKKLAVILLALLFLASCNKDNQSMKEMTLRKAVLTKEEQAILDLVTFKENTFIVDYKTDQNLKSLSVTVYEMVDKKWQVLFTAKSNPSVNKGRIALRFENIGQGAQVGIDSQGISQFQKDEQFDFSDVSSVTSYLEGEEPILYNQEIPLVIQLFTNKSVIASASPDKSFMDPTGLSEKGFDKVYAITCLFSDQ